MWRRQLERMYYKYLPSKREQRGKLSWNLMTIWHYYPYFSEGKTFNEYTTPCFTVLVWALAVFPHPRFLKCYGISTIFQSSSRNKYSSCAAKVIVPPYHTVTLNTIARYTQNSQTKPSKSYNKLCCVSLKPQTISTYTLHNGVTLSVDYLQVPSCNVMHTCVLLSTLFFSFFLLGSRSAHT